MYDKNQLLQDAAMFAAKYHEGTPRKNDIGGLFLPYIVHPMEVAKTLWGWDIGDPNVLAAALCHDLLEDTSCTTMELENVIGYPATGYVDELTCHIDENWSREHKKEVKAAYMASFPTKTPQALIIKVADRICNTKDFLQFDEKCAKTYFHQADDLFKLFSARSIELDEVFGRGTLVWATCDIGNLYNSIHLEDDEDDDVAWNG